jgi:hypothetical protein
VRTLGWDTKRPCVTVQVVIGPSDSRSAHRSGDTRPPRSNSPDTRPGYPSPFRTEAIQRLAVLHGAGAAVGSRDWIHGGLSGELACSQYTDYVGKEVYDNVSIPTARPPHEIGPSSSQPPSHFLSNKLVFHLLANIVFCSLSGCDLAWGRFFEPTTTLDSSSRLLYSQNAPI